MVLTDLGARSRKPELKFQDLVYKRARIAKSASAHPRCAVHFSAPQSSLRAPTPAFLHMASSEPLTLDRAHACTARKDGGRS